MLGFVPHRQPTLLKTRTGELTADLAEINFAHHNHRRYAAFGQPDHRGNLRIARLAQWHTGGFCNLGAAAVHKCPTLTFRVRIAHPTASYGNFHSPLMMLKPA
jgi:hypothetical protein